MSISFDLTSKLILITGASSGIGQAIAIHAAQAGARVLLVGRNEKRLEETRSQCEGRGVSCPHDLSELDDLPKFVRALAKEHGPLAGFVHSAGMEQAVPLRALRPSHLDEVFRINLFSGIMLLKGMAIRGCHATNSSAIFLSSVAGHFGKPGISPYCMSKGAIEQAVKSLSLELLSVSMRVNAIAPAMIRTPMQEQLFSTLSETEQNNILKDHPNGMGEPEDVAAAAIYLLSDASKYVTGTSLLIDGGYCAQ